MDEDLLSDCSDLENDTSTDALPRQSGHHIGIALARTLYKKLSSHGVTSYRIGWSVADKASNNNTCLEALSDLLEFEATE
jgi:hypothetical protein